ncbi:MAG: iron-containing alcohol dehydrogenase [Planctomycetes bacterium]|nr:iron-containing alcohol dehydrogenase [Planctomycetota bacterium]
MNDLTPFDFALRTRILFGPGKLTELGDLSKVLGSKAMLVLYEEAPGLEEYVALAEHALIEARVDVIRFERIQPDPKAAIAEEGARLAQREGIDLIIGIGGGSVLDTAKGISMLTKNVGGVWDYVMCNPDRREPEEALPKILIPTTSGTGSEVSAGAVFTDPQREMKGTIVSPMNAPEIALIDPRLTLGMPPELTAACGADALGHCLECTISKNRTPLGRAFSYEGVRLAARHLRAAVHDGGDIVARSGMALAATYGGLGLAYSAAIGTHSLSHAMGALVHVPHGLCIGLIEPHMLLHNLSECMADYVALAPMFGVERRGRGDEAVARNFIAAVTDLLRSIGIPERIRVKPDQTTGEFARALAKNAKKSTPKSVEFTPAPLTMDDMVEMYLNVVHS